MANKKYIMQLAAVFACLIIVTACGKAEGPLPKDEFLVIAHRGASAYTAENTLAAFELAEKLDAEYIELDIHLTKDGELAVMHDDDVAETTKGEGKIASYTMAELKKLSFDTRSSEQTTVSYTFDDNKFAVPTLQEVFDQFGKGMKYIVELKDPDDYPGIEQKLIDLLEEYDLIGQDENDHPKAAIHSFDEDGLKRVHEIRDDIPLIQLISFKDDEKASVSDEKLKDLLTYASGVGISYEAITQEFVEDMHKNDLFVYAYTVNDTEEALKLMAMGVDGVHTDEPDILDKKEEK